MTALLAYAHGYGWAKEEFEHGSTRARATGLTSDTFGPLTKEGFSAEDSCRFFLEWDKGYREFWKKHTVEPAPQYDDVDAYLEDAVTDLLRTVKKLGGSPVGLVVAALQNIGVTVEDYDKGWHIQAD